MVRPMPSRSTRMHGAGRRLHRSVGWRAPVRRRRDQVSEVIGAIATAGMCAYILYDAWKHARRTPAVEVVYVDAPVDEAFAAAARLLRVREDATSDEVESAFRKKIVSAHPDRGGTEQATRELIEARETMLQRIGARH